ncbi:MAG: polyhydroxyalkanoic acid system family protein [Bdellovibrionaceae bacterium]|nr:polyhydroxyalkanoic acid system family protein [Pseudobdellovibrionaceae bacterium]
MPKFTIEHQTQKPVDETFGAVKKFLSSGAEIQKFDPKAQVQFDDAKKACKISGGQFKAEMSVLPDSNGSKVSVMVDLPLLLTPFKGKVQETLKKMLSKHLA